MPQSRSRHPLHRQALDIVASLPQNDPPPPAGASPPWSMLSLLGVLALGFCLGRLADNPGKRADYPTPVAVKQLSLPRETVKPAPAPQPAAPLPRPLPLQAVRPQRKMAPTITPVSEPALEPAQEPATAREPLELSVDSGQSTYPQGRPSRNRPRLRFVGGGGGSQAFAPPGWQRGVVGSGPGSCPNYSNDNCQCHQGESLDRFAQDYANTNLPGTRVEPFRTPWTDSNYRHAVNARYSRYRL